MAGKTLNRDSGSWLKKSIVSALMVAMLFGATAQIEAAPFGDPGKAGSSKAGKSKSGKKGARKGKSRRGRSSRARRGNSRSRRNASSRSRVRAGTTRTRSSRRSASSSSRRGTNRGSSSRTSSGNGNSRALSGRQKFGDTRSIKDINKMFNRNYGKATSNGSRIANITFREKGKLSKPNQPMTIKTAKMIGSVKRRH